MAEENVNEEKAPVIPPTRRADILNNALRCLPIGATANERQRAINAGRAAMGDNQGVNEPQLIEAVKLAVACVSEDARRRLRQDYWRTHASDFLPRGADDEDKREAVKQALTRAEELPIEMNDYKVSEEICDALRRLCKEIEARKAALREQEERERKKSTKLKVRCAMR